MNTEINFLEKQPKKYIAPLVLGIVCILLLACAIAVFLVQKNTYENQIEVKKNKASQLETQLLEQQDEFAEEQKLQELQQEVVALKAEKIPNVILYKEMLAFLSSSEQLLSYDYTSVNQLIIDAEFVTLKDVSIYVNKLLKQDYVKDTELTSVSKMKTSYQATLTISLDSEILVKELGEND
ncbi:hypothetical protein SAMN05216232_1583 [Virgibacillus subterraneus]|uniref:Uncharacterized protein n=1 Tax=Virgibacillus subterraneus TaxID=621109 RepID=A0A1H9DCG6_9BACI|nr:hypothetical protein [Virgibacillus subterraneus]SEQ11164.1 hypothetical protein SAMN05216232_1583 [Virgibacillus subterraneus]